MQLGFIANPKTIDRTEDYVSSERSERVRRRLSSMGVPLWRPDLEQTCPAATRRDTLVSHTTQFECRI
jgi:hypothetical protein